jgi:hypothetical protein
MNPLNLKHSLVAAGVLALALSFPGTPARADVVTDWNAAFQNSLITTVGPTNQRGPRVPVRPLAIMHVAMFDAVNGIDRRYEPCFVTALAPPGARAEAAAIQAAYTVLSALLPAHQAAYDAQLQASLAALAGIEGNSQSIARGRAWGESVARAIIAWRSTDGSTTVLPPFVGSTAAGFWRHAPLGAAPNAGLANLVTVPFVLTNPLSFDSGPPYGFANRVDALASAAYAADVNEVAARGGAISTVRTAEELEEARFIDACDVAGFNQVLRSKVQANARLVETAREFALLNMTAFDVGIVIFRSKYLHELWRPFQAINFADEDGLDATVKDAAWTSNLPTPSHPECISAHVAIFTSLAKVIGRLEGDSTAVEFTAAPSAYHPGGAKTFASLAAISDAAVEGRIDVGFHFRDTCESSQIVGRAVGDAIVDTALRPVSH